MKMAACWLAAGLAGVVWGADWEVKTYREGDRVDLSEANGVVKIAWDIEPGVSRISGCFRHIEGWADVLFKEPVKLGAEEERVIFETRQEARCDRTTVLLSPLVRDEDGELFCYAYQDAPHLREGADKIGKWVRHKTPSFYAGEAGAASQDVFTLEGDGVDFTPGKKLEFLGFRLKLRQETGEAAASGKRGRRRSGTTYLGDWRAAGARIEYAHPFAYADTFLKKAGEYRLSAQIRNEFQAAPVREISRVVKFDPEDQASRKQKLEFPLGPDGCYWIDWQLTDAAGAVVRGGSLREEAYGNPDKAGVAAVDVKAAPALGMMRVNPEHKGCGVYGPEERARIEVRVFPKAGRKLKLKWKTLPLWHDNVLEEGEADVPGAGDGKFAATWLEPKRFEGRPAMRLELELEDGGKKADAQTYYFGWRNAPGLARHDRAGELADRREYKKQPYNRTTFSVRDRSSGGPKTEAAYLEVYRKFLRESKNLTTSFTHMIDLMNWEVLPGVYDTYLADKIMDMAADHGMRVTVRLAHADANGTKLYRWNKYQRQISADGTKALGHRYYGAYSVLDPETDKLWLDAYRALFDRYQGHCAFEGYYIMQPGGEWTVVDQPWDGTFSGYDAATGEAFRKWLGKKYGTVEELNRAWGTQYKEIGQAETPLPDFRGGMKPDFRRNWIDFCRFKEAMADEWMNLSVGTIRSYDDDRITIAYDTPRKLAAKLGGKLDYGHNGGNHYGHDLWEYIDAWKEHKVGWISEPHHPHAWSAYGDPEGRGWVLDWTTWVMTAQAAGGGANIHVYYYPWKETERVAVSGALQSFDRFETFKPILEELHKMEVYRPESAVAFGADRMTLWTKHRTTFGARLVDLRLFRETLEQDSVQYGNFLPERMDEHKLIFPNPLDEALEKETYENYVKAVTEKGARMVMTARTGCYVPELFGEEPFRLLKAFGITPPSGEYCRKGLNVEATCGEDAVLFEAGRKIPFETGDRLHAQLLDPAVQKRFWKFRFRWLPETDYFGYYPGVKTNGRTLATFADGGTAISLHKAGKGEVIVFWGLPDYDGDNLKGMAKAAAKWAGYRNPQEDFEVQHFIEGDNKRMKRHYLLLWKGESGEYTVRAPNLPDGEWFVDDMVSGQKLGLFDGKTVREKGMKVAWHDGYSGLKYLRFLNRRHWGGGHTSNWFGRFRNELPKKDAKENK